ncbi:MAG TPA: UDP-3-O-[3-hydroxymyristoyl] N-acetylglucosamine deacetylase [Acidobacteria bacterium]|nr:UDP-3-O-[3-hydroxymyristoyl] N-acetylglucosamine deacetylase [Acidobacteriota bacterium]
MRLQRTIGREVELVGVGLHRGETTRLRIVPAPVGTGMVFVRDDLGGEEVPALQQYRVPMVNASRLRRGAATVETPEHLLAALFCLGVDNVRLHLDGSEVPILDGSSLPFAWALVGAGTVEQEAPRPTLAIHTSLSVEEDDRGLEIHPGRGLQLTAAIDFEHRHLGYQELTVRLDQQADFLAKLAPARTFALRRDIQRLQEAGLIRGGSLDNAILVDEDGIQGGSLRFPDEFVRHKLLDLVGDLALLGCSLEGRIVAWRAGHGLHGRLVDAILAHRQCWAMAPDGSLADPPASPAPPGSERQ